MLKENLLLRSMLFVPAYKKHFIEKSLDCKTDAIIFDMEDSVPPEYRKEARENLSEYFLNGRLKNKQVFIRINELDSPDYKLDMKKLFFDDLTGYMLPKVRNQKDIYNFEKKICQIEIQNHWKAGKFLFAPLIETADAIIHLDEIAKASSRNVALCFGGEDYLTDLKSIYTHQNEAFIYPRSKIVVTARANHLIPIDTPYLNLGDLEGLYKEEHDAYKIGFAGCLLVSPSQISPANKAFTPDKDEIRQARDIINAVHKSIMDTGLATTKYKNKLIGPPMRKRAELILEQIELIKKYDEEKDKMKKNVES